MNKPLKDWTLGEIQQFCKGIDDCEKCIFKIKFCDDNFSTAPLDWDLTDTPTLTPDELAVLRLLMDLEEEA